MKRYIITACLLLGMVLPATAQVATHSKQQIEGVVEAFRMLRVGLGGGRCAPPLGDQKIFCGIDPDSIQPCVKSRVAAKMTQCPKCLDERFLHHIFRLRRIVDQAANQAHQATLVLGDQQVERLPLACLDARYQDLITFAFIRHTGLWDIETLLPVSKSCFAAISSGYFLRVVRSAVAGNGTQGHGQLAEYFRRGTVR